MKDLHTVLIAPSKCNLPGQNLSLSNSNHTMVAVHRYSARLLEFCRILHCWDCCGDRVEIQCCQDVRPTFQNEGSCELAFFSLSCTQQSAPYKGILWFTQLLLGWLSDLLAIATPTRRARACTVNISGFRTNGWRGDDAGMETMLCSLALSPLKVMWL